MKKRLPGLLITGLFAIALGIFMGILVATKLIPTKFLLLVGVILFLLVLCVYFLSRDTRRLGPLLTGCFIIVMVLAVVLFGTVYLAKAMDTLNDITNVEVEFADVGIYVRAEDGADSLTSVSGYTFGILEELDRENTDTAIADIETQMGAKLTVQTYPGLTELIDGILTTKQCDAVIVNSAYLELLADMEGYENAFQQLKEVYVQKVETQIEMPTEPPTEDKSIMDLLIPSESTEPTKPESNAFTVYISGIDSRGGLISKSRSDVNILAVVNPDTHQVLLVSTPRDFYVPLPRSNGMKDKLTHAGIYGIKESVGTMEMLYDMDIDYYFRVNFSGFEKIINALGGVEVYSAYSFSADGFSYRKGMNKMNGEKALAFARERHAFAAGDRQRGKNQMEVIKGVINKVLSPSLLKNYSKILDSVSGRFETSVPYDMLAELVRKQLDEGGDWNIVTYSVNGTGDTKKNYSMNAYAYVMVPNQDTVNKAKTMIQQVYDGEVPGEETE